MKPILFNTEMVRAILEGRKTVTRRPIKPRPEGVHHILGYDAETNMFEFICGNGGEGGIFLDWTESVKAPYRPGDILYVREMWAAWSRALGLMPKIHYKADGENLPGIKWRPSIHMPKEAARIFLRVTDIRVERLQDGFPDNGAAVLNYVAEGVTIPEECRVCIDAYGYPCCSDLDPDLPFDETTGEDSAGGSECGLLDDIRSEFFELWNSTIKPADRPLDGWAANPWVWVIEFERISGGEAANG